MERVQCTHRNRLCLIELVFLSVFTAHDDHLKFPIPTPENDWKGFKREWPDDGYALGDYPNLPDISYQRRQHKGWWDWQDRRNFNEPVIRVLTCIEYIKNQGCHD